MRQSAVLGVIGSGQVVLNNSGTISTLGTTMNRAIDITGTGCRRIYRDHEYRDDHAFDTGLAAGQLSGTAFERNTSSTAADASDRIIYEPDTDKLYVDRDGTGATAKVHFATVGANITLTAADFVVV